MHNSSLLPQRPDDPDEPFDAIREMSRGCLGYAIGACIGLVLAVIVSCLTGCQSPRTVIEYRDSIRTEVRVETVVVHDTIRVFLPRDSVVVITADTASHIETSVAVSEASVRYGLLLHAIWNKPDIPVVVETRYVTRDSIVYRDRDVPVPTPVEVPRDLTGWQWFRLWLGNLVIVALAVAAAVFVVRRWRKGKGIG